jgi:hypothetical protein
MRHQQKGRATRPGPISRFGCVRDLELELPAFQYIADDLRKPAAPRASFDEGNASRSAGCTGHATAERTHRPRELLPVDTHRIGNLPRRHSVRSGLHQQGIPDRCDDCGSYKMGLWAAEQGEAMRPRCQACGWMAPERAG